MKSFFISILVLFIVSCSSPEAKPEIEVDTTANEVHVNLNSTIVDYATDESKMTGYLVNDNAQQGKKPGVLVVHEWWGHNEYARQRADRLAELGYVAFAVDMYGDGKKASHPKDAMKFAGEVFGNIEEAKLRFDKALEILKSNSNVDTTKIAAIGYCFGGSVVLSMANAGKELDAVAAFHAGLQLPIEPNPDGIQTKIAVYQGADDPFVSEEDVANYKASLEKVGATYEYKAYEQAVHAFTSEGADSLGKAFDLPLAYNAKADSASWADMQQFFEKHLK